MELFDINLSVLVIALITAYFGFQFNNRAKKKELFLKELSISYTETYFPMNELLQEISNTEDRKVKHQLIDNFINQLSGPQSKVKYIGSSYLLESFYELRMIFNNYKKDPSRATEKALLDKVRDLTTMIENEYWDAHDIIYEEYLQFRDNTFKNPIVVFFLGLLRFFYYLSTFSVWISLGFLYFAFWNKVVGIDSFPDWWTIQTGFLFLSASLAIYGGMLSVKSFAIKKNRRKSRVVMQIKGKLKSIFRR